jgi:glycosyltransferase involved in cell wall biosynthesis
MNHSVSIILCTRNRAQSLQLTLDSLNELSSPYECELVVVDNGSTDSTGELIRAFTRSSKLPVKYISEPRKGKSHALNTGVKSSAGTVLLFTDDDVRVPSGWIEGMCHPILSGQASAVQGGIRWAPDLLSICGEDSYLPKVITSTRHKSQAELSRSLIGANMAIARSVFDQIHGFDTELGPGALGLGEETLFARQMLERGMRIAQALDIEVEHHFDAMRLTRSGLFALAAAKGRSIAFFDHHWEHRTDTLLSVRKSALLVRDFVRTLISPSAWPNAKLIPEWKYSYRTSISRLEQLHIERIRPRKYERPMERKLSDSKPTFAQPS